MKEIVMNKNEFDSLTEGRIHWCIEKEPIYITANDGSKPVQSGEVRLILSVSGIAKDGGHIVQMKVNCGAEHRFSNSYQDKLEKIAESAKEEFPDATEGVWQ